MINQITDASFLYLNTLSAEVHGAHYDNDRVMRLYREIVGAVHALVAETEGHRA